MALDIIKAFDLVKWLALKKLEEILGFGTWFRCIVQQYSEIFPVNFSLIASIQIREVFREIEGILPEYIGKEIGI